ncbi:hypothetical protein [Bradyrhizobium icense]|uniref:hypothetical protein n=1 Tax=Bradyrhizobium icense TaxID=1274631 RepID=UPI0012EB0445|nr:hypothetical protein [Bradyrhizobium icense]
MASRFWVGGTGTWNDSSTANWSATSGGASGASVPSSADTVTFDGSSGGGTVTVAATINASNTIQSLVCGAFTGTLDFATNNPNITFNLSSSPNFSISGTGTRTINLGSGTFTLVGNNGSVFDAATTTNLTFNAGTSTIQINNPANGNSATFAGGGLTYNIVTFGARSGGSQISISGNNTFAALNLNPPTFLTFGNGSAQGVTAPLAWNGSSSAQFNISSGADTKATINCAVGSVISWALIRGMAFAGTTVPATNSFDLKNNSGVTITAPGGTAAAKVIGG